MEAIDELATRIWRWRAQSQPRLRDDIVRLDRAAGWRPDLGLDTMARRRSERDGFARELARIVPQETADRVDHRLLQSTLARVTWELDVIRLWQAPRFYTDQALGPVYDLLLPPGVDAHRVADVIGFLDDVPAVLDIARHVLPGRMVAEFTRLAVDELAGIAARLDTLAVALADVDPLSTKAIHASCTRAGAALVAYHDWLSEQTDLPPAAPVGRANYEWFLREVACIPLDINRIRTVGMVEADRALTLEVLARRRHERVPELALPPDAATQSRREANAEAAVRQFYVEQGLLSQPASLRHYLTAEMPPYLQPLRFLGVADDLTGPDRLEEDGISYFPPPSPSLPYFYAANARDPRAGIVHEGAHYQQLALSWRNPRPVRRHYYDSAANEGIAFYNEEMMLASGLFDDSPHTQTVIYNFMRLRALRVEVDIALALGELSVDQAAGVLERSVPMDADTAREEAAFFAESPGQAISYQVGKTQILALQADAAREKGEEFDLRTLHDYLWVNGNVPIALLRWELLGLDDELDRIGVIAP